MADRTRRAAPLAVLVLVAAAAAALLVMGRSPWCRCGEAIPWAFDIRSAHNSQHLVDPYSFTHVLHGFAFYALLALPLRRVALAWRAVIALALESAWEIVENTDAVIRKYREATISLDYYGDSVANSVADIGMCAIGFLLASRLPTRVSIALFVVTELALLAWIRDSLVVNVIMLLWPIEAIRQWQMGAQASA